MQNEYLVYFKASQASLRRHRVNETELCPMGDTFKQAGSIVFLYHHQKNLNFSAGIAVGQIF